MAWLSLLLSSILAFSQPQGERPDNPEYLAYSRLVTIRVVPAGKKAQIFLAGNEAAQLDVQNNHKLLQVTAVSPNRKREVLQFRRNGPAYEVTDLPDWEEGFQLYLKTETRGTVEESKTPMLPRNF